MIYIHICGFDHPDKYTNHETGHLWQQSWQTVMLTYLLKPDSHASAARPRRVSPHLPALTLLRSTSSKTACPPSPPLTPFTLHRRKQSKHKQIYIGSLNLKFTLQQSVMRKFFHTHDAHLVIILRRDFQKGRLGIVMRVWTQDGTLILLVGTQHCFCGLCPNL